MKDAVEQPLGSFHQCYRLDGRLVAMGVIDLLPHAVSGVYFVYHQDVEKWSFGKLSAAREASLALEKCYEFYYMGYYIHDCVKMKYKGDYKPQHILDPLSYAWDELDEEYRELLDRRKFVSRSLERQRTEGKVSDDPEQWPYQNPLAATSSGKSVFEVRVPGVMTIVDIEEHVILDEVCFALRPDLTVCAGDLQQWDESDSYDDGSTLKGLAAELVAFTGPEAVQEIAIDFTR